MHSAIVCQAFPSARLGVLTTFISATHPSKTSPVQGPQKGSPSADGGRGGVGETVSEPLSPHHAWASAGGFSTSLQGPSSQGHQPSIPTLPPGWVLPFKS